MTLLRLEDKFMNIEQWLDEHEDLDEEQLDEQLDRVLYENEWKRALTTP